MSGFDMKDFAQKSIDRKRRASEGNIMIYGSALRVPDVISRVAANCVDRVGKTPVRILSREAFGGDDSMVFDAEQCKLRCSDPADRETNPLCPALKS